MIDMPLGLRCHNHRRAVACVSCAVCVRRFDRYERKPPKVSGRTHGTTNADRVIGNEPRRIKEFSGWLDLSGRLCVLLIYGIRVDGLSPATRLSSGAPPLSSGVHLPWRDNMMDDETVDSCTGFSLVGGVADRSERM